MGGINMSEMVMSILAFAIPVLFAITIHESAHGYVAKYFGDNTAFSLGRITLNPIKHIDPIGTILIPLLLIVFTKGAFVFGWAKPVPVNFNRLRNPKRDMLWVAIAGPVSNIIQSVIWAIFLLVLIKTGVNSGFFAQMAAAGIIVNLVLCVLNLLPIPPLDGGRVLVSLLPMGAARKVSRIEPYGIQVLFAVIIIGSLTGVSILGRYWINPLVNICLNVLNLLIFRPMGVDLQI